MSDRRGRPDWVMLNHLWAQEDLADPLFMIAARERTGRAPAPHCLIPDDHPARWPRGLVDRPITWPANI